MSPSVRREKMKHRIRLFFVYFGTSVLALALSNESLAAGNLNVAAQKTRLQLAEEPKGAAQVLAVQKQFASAKTQPNALKTRDVVLVGQIGGMPNIWPETHPQFPWYEGQASFFMVDSKVAAQFASHLKKHGGNHECSFCKSLAAKNAHAIAVINLVDEKGEILRVDTRKLLALKENQTVVIRGKAKLLGGSMLIVDADGVFVPQK
jgi:hypothetical protein